MSDQETDTTEYSSDVDQEVVQETEQGEAGEQQEPNQEPEGKDSGGGDTGSDYVETDDPKVIARFGHLTRKATEAERKALALQKQIDELQQKVTQSDSRQPAAAVKEVAAPDPDLAIDNPEEFKRQQKAYVDYVREEERRSVQGEQEKQYTEAQKLQKLQERVTSYVERADKAGIAKEALAEAGNAIEPFMSEDLRDTILTDEDGPALTVYLHENVSDLSALLEASKESPYRAGQAIERMRAKLASAKKPKSDLPPPPTRVRGARTSGKTEDGTLYE